VLPKVEDIVRKKLKILYEEKEVKQIYLNTVTLLCSGNEPIRPDDYEGPIALDFGSTVEILSAEIVKPSKRCLEPSFKVENGSVNLLPILMNHGDRIDMKILTESHPEKMTIHARIAGVDETKNIMRHENVSYWAIQIGAMLALAGIGMSVPIVETSSNIFNWQFVVILVLISVGLSLVTIGRFIIGPKLRSDK
jgi:hypothetical protein